MIEHLESICSISTSLAVSPHYFADPALTLKMDGNLSGLYQTTIKNKYKKTLH